MNDNELHMVFSDGLRMTANNDAKKALEKVIIDWANVNDVTVEAFDVDETTIDVPGIVISCDKGSEEISYSLVHMLVNEDGVWKLKWVRDDTS